MAMKRQERIIEQEFEGYEFESPGGKVYCWFTAKCKIITEIKGDDITEPLTSESRFQYLDISDLGFTKDPLGEDLRDALSPMYNTLGKSITIEDFRF